MYHWNISHSKRDGFRVELYESPLWTYLLEWPIDWTLRAGDSLPGEKIQVGLYRLANGMVGYQSRHQRKILSKSLSDSEAMKLDPEFFQLFDGFWSDEDA